MLFLFLGGKGRECDGKTREAKRKYHQHRRRRKSRSEYAIQLPNVFSGNTSNLRVLWENQPPPLFTGLDGKEN